MSCWMAPRDVPGGANWRKTILDAIETAEIFVVLLSSGANRSVHMANEIDRAASYRKTIVPLRIENVMPSREIELHISARHCGDLFRRAATEGAKHAPIPRRTSRRPGGVIAPDIAPLGETAPTKPTQGPVLRSTGPRPIADRGPSTGIAPDRRPAVPVEPARACSATPEPPKAAHQLKCFLSVRPKAGDPQ